MQQLLEIRTVICIYNLYKLLKNYVRSFSISRLYKTYVVCLENSTFMVIPSRRKEICLLRSAQHQFT